MQFPKLENRRDQSEFKTPKFLRINEGEMIIRFLGPIIYDVKTHWVSGVTIKCLDEDCPICQNNEKIRIEHPEDYKDIPGYIPWRNSFYTNVYDKTPVKICTDCGSEIQSVKGIFPSSCWKCQTIVSAEEAKPSNTIKVLNRGVQLRDQLKLVNKSVLDENDEEIGIENYDVKFRTGSNKEPIPIEMPSSNEPVEYNEEDLFELELVPLVLKPEEINDLLRGVKVKDILIARNAEADVIESPVEEEIKKTSSKVKSLFRG